MARPDSDAEIMIHSHPYNLGKQKRRIPSGNPSRFEFSKIWLPAGARIHSKVRV
jgi:hypothetical protein